MAPKGKSGKGKKSAPPAAPMPATTSTAPKAKEVKKVQPKKCLFTSKPKSFRIGGDIQPKRDLSRFLRWPKYINLQRKKRILMSRLKVPPMIAQFQNTFNKNQTKQVVDLAKKYKPETPKEKKERLVKIAKQQESGADVTEKKPMSVAYGLRNVTSLIESKKARLVVIAHDVDPIELVICLPTICRKMDVPYCIVKGQSLLGQMIGSKHTSCLAFTNVRKEDQDALNTLIKTARTMFNDNMDVRRRWGGGVMGVKSQHVMKKREAAIAAENAKKIGLQV